MVNRQGRSKPKLAFIVCKPGSDIKPLVEILGSLEVQTLNTEDTFDTSKMVVNSTVELIAAADFVCAVIQEETGPNVFFELGYALGAGLPIILIGDAAQLPSDLANQFSIRVPISDTAALSFQIRAFLDNSKTMRHKSRSDLLSRNKKPLLETSKLISHNGPQSELEQRLITELQLSKEIDLIATQPRIKTVEHSRESYIPDLAIWFKKAPETIGNQVIIEVKRYHLPPEGIAQAVQQIRTYARLADIRTGLVLTDALKSSEGPVASLLPLVFTYALADFYALLQSGKLVETLRRERNRYAHSAG